MRSMDRKYDPQFRQQAMDLVRVSKMDPAHAARELGMPLSTLNLWLKKARWIKQVEPAVPLPEDPLALKVRVAELERQVKRLELEKEILKKATAFFASQSP
jgi:transposase